MVELKHLRTLHTLAEIGSIRKAADKLFTSQSALSHQIKELECKLGQTLFVRNSQPIAFTPAGEILLVLANSILPEVEAAKTQIKTLKSKQQALTATIDCHACFQWLIPVVKILNEQHGISLEFSDNNFDKLRSTAELRFTEIALANDEKNEDIHSYAIGNFEQLLLLSPNNPLAKKTTLSANDIVEQTLLTYPLPITELDIYQHIFKPNNLEPKWVKQIQNSHTIGQMVAAEMGVALLPDWLIYSFNWHKQLTARALPQYQLDKTLYLIVQQQKVQPTLINAILPVIRQSFAKLKD